MRRRSCALAVLLRSLHSGRRHADLHGLARRSAIGDGVHGHRRRDPHAEPARDRAVWDADDEAFGAEPLASQLANLKDGDLYLNVHTPPFPNGEIRGQIVPEPATAVLLGLGTLGLALRSQPRRRTP